MRKPRARTWLLGLAVAGLLAPTAQAGTICTAVADIATGEVLLAQGACAERVTPASTFKIALSLMGYDAGLLTDAHAPARPFVEGYVDWRPEWRRTTDPTSWMENSVVWYSQELTRSLGPARFEAYVRAFQYGNQDVSGGLTTAWLSSSLKISPLEQLAFLGRVVRNELPVTPRATAMTARLTALEATPGGWSIHGKTGAGAPRTETGAYDASREYGWYVGWADKGGRTLAFAYLIQADPADARPVDLRAREEFLAQAPGLFHSLGGP